MKSISIAKPGQGCINEDFALANEHVLAISDGAGGGGIYADRWANYLVNNLPITPICSFDETRGLTEYGNHSTMIVNNLQKLKAAWCSISSMMKDHLQH